MIGFEKTRVGLVYLWHSTEEEPFASIGDLGQISTQSIEIPSYSWKITPITPASDSDLPSFEYMVDGFYPREPIIENLSGDVSSDGKNQRITASWGAHCQKRSWSKGHPVEYSSHLSARTYRLTGQCLMLSGKKNKKMIFNNANNIVILQYLL